MASFRGIVGVSVPQSSLSAPDQQHGSVRNTPPAKPNLPSFTRILDIFLKHVDQDETGPKKFLTNSMAFHEFAFSPQRPIIGSGHHFVVYASPFADDEKSLLTAREISKEVYCIKGPNLIHGTSDRGPGAFKEEYYHTVLQELRILFHPNLSKHDNIINILGFDFYEDYDDYTIAWPVLLMEYAEYGTLDTLQQDVDISLQPELARWLLLDIALGIQALHRCNIVHGDVKSENVLICRHSQRAYVARLSDFGLSVINPDPSIGNNHRLPGGTWLWAAPEWKERLDVDGLRMTDVYSFGLTAWRVLVNYPNPWTMLDGRQLGLQGVHDVNDLAARAKARDGLADVVLWTMKSEVLARGYSRVVIESTLCKDPAGRDLERAISALALGQKTFWNELVISHSSQSL